MGIFKKNDAFEEAAESGRLRPEDLVGPRPDRQDEATSDEDEVKSTPDEEVKVEDVKVKDGSQAPSDHSAPDDQGEAAREAQERWPREGDRLR
jgi:hypothetical protein